MRKLAMFLFIFLTLPLSFSARGDMFGADVAVLGQILQQNILQLTQLKQMFQTGSDQLGLLRDINRGINDSLQMAQTFGIPINSGVYSGLGQVGQALQSVESIFGVPVASPLNTIQLNTDQTVAEAISFNNEITDYSSRLDQVGEQIKTYSHEVSPGGAEKLTAESLGVMIHVLNQQMRATGQGLKLQAQALALENKRQKDQTAEYLNEGNLLMTRMQALNPTFQVPRF